MDIRVMAFQISSHCHYWFHYYITIHLRICLHGLDLLFKITYSEKEVSSALTSVKHYSSGRQIKENGTPNSPARNKIISMKIFTNHFKCGLTWLLKLFYEHWQRKMLSNQRIQSFRMRRNHFIQVIYSLQTARDTQRTGNKLLSQPALFRPILIDYTVNIVFTLQLMKIDELQDLKRPMSFSINHQMTINQDVKEVVLLNGRFMNIVIDM